MKKLIIITQCLWVFISLTFAQSFDVNRNLTSELDVFLNKEFKSDEPGCVVVIAQGEKIIYKNAVGLADLENNIPMKSDMIFEIGSNSKQFAAVAIMQLVEQGKIALDNTLKKYFPDFPTQDYEITIEHLLSNTSGLTDIFRIDGFGPNFWRQDYTQSEYMNFLKKAKVDFVPGTKYSYCNTGYILLSYIVEQISGLSYPEYIKENIFKKSGMTNSYYGSYHKIIKNRASGYSYNEDNMSFENIERVSWTIVEGAGDLMCNAEDFIKYYNVLNSYKLISKESLKKTRTSYKLPDGSETGFGYGLAIGKLEGIPYITFSGGITGYFTSHIYFPSENVHAIIFTNCDGYLSKDPTSKIGEMIFNK